jgi:hypothetical protein
MINRKFSIKDDFKTFLLVGTLYRRGAIDGEYADGLFYYCVTEGKIDAMEKILASVSAKGYRSRRALIKHLYQPGFTEKIEDVFYTNIFPFIRKTSFCKLLKEYRKAKKFIEDDAGEDKKD